MKKTDDLDIDEACPSVRLQSVRFVFVNCWYVAYTGWTRKHMSSTSPNPCVLIAGVCCANTKDTEQILMHVQTCMHACTPTYIHLPPSPSSLSPSPPSPPSLPPSLPACMYASMPACMHACKRAYIRACTEAAERIAEYRNDSSLRSTTRSPSMCTRLLTSAWR